MKLKHIFFSLAALAFFSAAQAQVKVGANPGTIGTNSALEVEATNGKKVMVDKATGTLQVENLLSGTTTDSVVVSDGTGVLKRINTATLRQSVGVYGAAQASTATNQGIGGGGAARANFTQIDTDETGSFNLSTDTYEVKSTGLYQLAATIRIYIPGSGQRSNVDVQLMKTPAAGGADLVVASAQGEQNATFDLDLSISSLELLTAGDKIYLRIATCNGCISGNPTFTVRRSRLTVARLK